MQAGKERNQRHGWQRYRLRHFWRFSFFPAGAPGWTAVLLAVRACGGSITRLAGSCSISRRPARQILSSLSSSMLTFIVFAVSSLLLAWLPANARPTPRITALVFSMQRVGKVSVGVFVFAYTFTVGTLDASSICTCRSC